MRIVVLLIALVLAGHVVRAAKIFNGTTQAATVPNALNYPFTISAWAYAAASNNNFCVLCVQSNATGGGRLILGIVGSSGFSGIWRADAGGSAETNNGPLVQLNTWTHLAVVAASTNDRTLWVNGVKYGPNTVNPPQWFVPQSINIGQRWSSGFGQYWTGMLAEVAVWNSALSPEVITNLANGRTAINASPTAPILYLPMLEGTSSEYTLCGTNGAITLTNSPVVGTNHPPIYR